MLKAVSPSNDCGNHTNAAQRGSPTQTNPIIHITETQYKNTRSFALSGWDPMLPRRNIKEALASLYQQEEPC